jgi:hypothetical protein
MTTLLTTPTEITTGEPDWTPDEAHLAAAAFLARYRDRTLKAYRYPFIARLVDASLGRSRPGGGVPSPHERRGGRLRAGSPDAHTWSGPRAPICGAR